MRPLKTMAYLVHGKEGGHFRHGIIAEPRFRTQFMRSHRAVKCSRKESTGGHLKYTQFLDPLADQMKQPLEWAQALGAHTASSVSLMCHRAEDGAGTVRSHRRGVKKGWV